MVHEAFQNMPDNNAKLWRYLSLQKFEDLLKTQTLHLTRLDCYQDHMEGMWPKEDIKFLTQSQNGLFILNMSLQLRSQTVCSCWHENEIESAAMWDLYDQEQEGVAIQTTYEKLNNNVNEFCQDKNFISLSGVSRVKYLDHFQEKLIQLGANWPNQFELFMTKYKSYEHEKEVRILLFSPQNHFLDSGFKLNINAISLIDSIIVNPKSTKKAQEAIIEIASEYNLQDRLKDSLLAPASFYLKMIKAR